ncbi:hypothetical protein GmRootV35_29020 [Variovorax sp. V35]|uniref:Uncharacterized protein n=1 Tax=Variovorax boronicumulans TaxID=436515 RepID=A0A1E7TTF3_9BURK|nr:hypothetical protein [Variovorax boronicumulans]ATA53617.1 hypothetical protein CKY39_10615 [Variovorax boronicumulans]OEZ26920.1 hypothetical protein AO062_30595 [Variovorax boronicumulans]
MHVFAQIGAGRGCTCLRPLRCIATRAYSPGRCGQRIMVPLVVLTASRVTQELHNALVKGATRMLSG